MTLSNPSERSRAEDTLSDKGLFSPHSWLYKFGIGDFGANADANVLAYADANLGGADVNVDAYADANAYAYAYADTYADVNANAYANADADAYADADTYADVNANAAVNEDSLPGINNPLHLPEKYTQEERERQVLDLIVKTILER